MSAASQRSSSRQRAVGDSQARHCQADETLGLSDGLAINQSGNIRSEDRVGCRCGQSFGEDQEYPRVPSTLLRKPGHVLPGPQACHPTPIELTVMSSTLRGDETTRTILLFENGMLISFRRKGPHPPCLAFHFDSARELAYAGLPTVFKKRYFPCPPPQTDLAFTYARGVLAGGPEFTVPPTANSWDL